MLNFITGPLFVFSLLVFVVGLLVRAVLYVRGLDWRLERVAYGHHPERSIPGALVSIVKWLIPGGTNGWRSQPAAMASFFLLHLGAVLVPLFLLGHTVLLENFTGISLPSLPAVLADILSVMSLAGILLLVARRLASPALRQLNSGGDWLVLLLTLLPFCTGLMARLDTSAYQTWIVLHVLSGELFLILAPFTKLSHIVLYFMSRAQLGMDFAIKRGGGTRGGGGLNGIGLYRKERNIGLKNKLDQIKATGAQLVVTPCHNCWDAIRDMMEVYGEHNIKWSFLKPLLVDMMVVPPHIRHEAP